MRSSFHALVFAVALTGVIHDVAAQTTGMCSGNTDTTEDVDCGSGSLIAGAGSDTATCCNECGSDPCQNGASCTDGANAYICDDCPTGYDGTNCETALACTADGAGGSTEITCENGGTVAGTGTSCSCNCPTGFAGTKCDYALPCQATQQIACQNGTVTGTGTSCLCVKCMLRPLPPNMLPSDWPYCCEDGFVIDAVVTGVCTKCPHPQRCVAGLCALNSAGVGCAECADGHFAAGGRCLACPSDGLGVMMKVVAAITLVFLLGLWRITRVRFHDDEGDQGGQYRATEDHTQDTLNNIVEKHDTVSNALDNSVVKTAGTGLASVSSKELANTDIDSSLSNSAIYASLATTHLQFSTMALQLPFGFPDALVQLSRAIGSLFTFDFGVIASPECNMQDEPIETLLVYKFGITQGAFFLLLGTIFLAKLHCGVHNSLHASNAGTALYTLSLTMLTNSCIRCFDCTENSDLGYATLDIAPSVVCWGGNDEQTSTTYQAMAASAVALFCVYCIVIPAWLFRHLKEGVKDGATADFLRANGWVVLKYKPNRWWFEIPQLYYKVLVVTTCALLDSEERAGDMLYVLIGAGACLWFLILVDAPFRDGEGHEGLTSADKAALVAQTSLLATYGIGYFCWKKQCAGESLSTNEELGTTIAGLALAVGPAAVMIRNILHQRKQRRLVKKEEHPGEAIFDNPVHAEDSESHSDQEKHDKEKKHKKKHDKEKKQHKKKHDKEKKQHKKKHDKEKKQHKKKHDKEKKQHNKKHKGHKK